MAQYNPKEFSIGGDRSQYYSYDEELYTSTFPREWVLTHDADNTGPKHCNNCNYYGSWNGVFIGYCGNCAIYIYKGKRGCGFKEIGKETESFIDDNTCSHLQENAIRATDTYLKNINFDEIGDVDFLDSHSLVLANSRLADRGYIYTYNNNDHDNDHDNNESSYYDDDEYADMPPLIHYSELYHQLNGDHNIDAIEDEGDDNIPPLIQDNNTEFNLQAFHNIVPMQQTIGECGEYDDEYYNTIKYYINKFLDNLDDDKEEDTMAPYVYQAIEEDDKEQEYDDNDGEDHTEENHEEGYDSY